MSRAALLFCAFEERFWSSCSAIYRHFHHLKYRSMLLCRTRVWLFNSSPNSNWSSSSSQGAQSMKKFVFSLFFISHWSVNCLVRAHFFIGNSRYCACMCFVCIGLIFMPNITTTLFIIVYNLSWNILLNPEIFFLSHHACNCDRGNYLVRWLCNGQWPSQHLFFLRTHSP